MNHAVIAIVFQTQVLMDDHITRAPYVSMIIDGWNNVTKDELVNVAFTTPEPIFIKTIDTGSNSQTSEYLFTLVKPVIEKYGADRIAGFVTDNASNMLSCGKNFVSKNYPNVIAVGCHAHQISLCVKDLHDHSSLGLIIKSANDLVKEIRGKTAFYSRFRQVQGELRGNAAKALKIIIETRFYRVSDLLNSLIDGMQALKIVISDSKRKSELSQSSIIKISDNENTFWQQLQIINPLFNSFSKAVGVLESNNAMLGDAFVVWRDMEKRVKDKIKEISEGTSILNSVDFKVFLSKFNKRIETALSADVLLAHILIPANRKIATKDKVYAMSKDEVKKYEKRLVELCTKMNRPIGLVLNTMADYKNEKEYFNSPLLQECANNPIKYWEAVKDFDDSKDLADIAIRYACIPPTNTVCERIFSSQKSTHSKTRNRLNHRTVQRLMAVKQNIKVLGNKLSAIDLSLIPDSDLLEEEADEDAASELDAFQQEFSLDANMESDSELMNIYENENDNDFE